MNSCILSIVINKFLPCRNLFSLVTLTILQSINWWIDQSINKKSIHPSINRSVNQSVSESINQSINQSIDQFYVEVFFKVCNVFKWKNILDIMPWNSLWYYLDACQCHALNEVENHKWHPVTWISAPLNSLNGIQWNLANPLEVNNGKAIPYMHLITVTLQHQHNILRMQQ